MGGKRGVGPRVGIPARAVDDNTITKRSYHHAASKLRRRSTSANPNIPDLVGTLEVVAEPVKHHEADAAIVDASAERLGSDDEPQLISVEP